MDIRPIVLLLLTPLTFVSAQSSSVLYRESFDASIVPALPAGWTTSVARNPSGDFVTSSSAPRSGSLPNCLSATDARVHQWTATPPISFAGRMADSLEFYERRTSTFTAGLLVEASVDGDTLFSTPLSDTLLLTTGNNGSYLRRALALPDSFSGRTDIRFRWRTVGHPSGGGTAVLRIEDVRISVRKVTDLALTSFGPIGAHWREGDTLRFRLGITNRAAPGTFSGTIQLTDSITPAASVPFTAVLAAQESMQMEISLTAVTAGRHPFRATLILAGDEDTTNNTTSIVVTAGMRSGALLINEIMYTPSSGMPEWVELVNTRSDTLVPTGWRISDAGATKAVLSGSGNIPPHAYGIVTTDTNAFRSFFDITAPLFQASFSALNNSGDAVVLYDRFGLMIDSLFFRSAWGGGTGRSLERIDTAYRSTDSTSWFSCRHPDGATPGTVNSVTRKRYDAAVRSLRITPQIPTAGTPLTVTVSVHNAGRESLPSTLVALMMNGTVQEQRTITVLSAGDSLQILFTVHDVPQGTHRCAAVIGAAGDDDATNDTLHTILTVGVPAASVIITEVMFAPPEGTPEWVELYNRSTLPVDLSGWTIADNGSTNAPLGTAPMTAAAGSHIIVTTDPLQFFASYPAMPETVLVIAAAMPSLNNTTPDAVVLRDGTRRTMDSVRYIPHWSIHPDHSLQRYDQNGDALDSADWRSDSPSPGSENPSGRKDYDAAVRSFSAVRSGSGRRLTATVVNAGRQMLSSAELRFVHDRDKDGILHPAETIASFIVGTLAPLDSVSHAFEWDVTLPGTIRLAACITAPGDEQPANDSLMITAADRFQPRTLVINEVMYEPRTGRAEFVELLNASSDTVDIEGWTLMDQPSSSGSRTMVPLASAARRIPPGRFLLIGSDTSVTADVPDFDDTLIIIAPSLSLSNSGEDIVLADLTGALIDSVRFTPSWHLRTIIPAGRSLERIDAHGGSNDSRNWSSSVASTGSTPLLKNSIELRPLAPSSSLSLQPNPFSPDQDGHEDFLSIGFRLPANSISIRVRIYDVSGRLIRTLVQNETFPSTGAVIWDGSDDQGHRVRIGPYIILLEALDNFGGPAAVMKGVAVAARKLR